MKSVCIVIPIYKTLKAASYNEIASIKQCFRVLFKYPIYFAVPDNLAHNEYAELANEFGVKLTFVAFDSNYFKSIDGYNRLMLSELFYRKFSAYNYLLIYQADAWIFKDDINDWCSMGYDYIGAPWVDWKWSDFASKHSTLPRTILSKLGYRKFNLVGNGGFSLRKTKSFIFNLKLFKFSAKRFKDNEDYFFSFHVNSYNPFFKIPPVEVALKFCFDENPEASFVLNNNQLPMACHAWPKYQNFWNKYIV